MAFENYWKSIHKKYFKNEIVYDNWLDSYSNILNKCKTKVLDLGCGLGNNTLYLTERGYDVVACDYSDIAIKKIKEKFKNVEAILVDISKELPFKDGSFDLVVADLSLHYFDKKTTLSIMNEIKRILTQKGNLIARVNSVEDTNHGAGKGKKLEENFYYVEGYNKRFFSEEDATFFFSVIGSPQIKKSEMFRHREPKPTLEIAVQKK